MKTHSLPLSLSPSPPTLSLPSPALPPSLPPSLSFSLPLSLPLSLSPPLSLNRSFIGLHVQEGQEEVRIHTHTMTH